MKNTLRTLGVNVFSPCADCLNELHIGVQNIYWLYIYDKRKKNGLTYLCVSNTKFHLNVLIPCTHDPLNFLEIQFWSFAIWMASKEKINFF
jgi:hypothetical protein